MLGWRCHLLGLFAVLPALAVQLAIGGGIPRPNPVTRFANVEILCHGAADTGGAPAKIPVHPGDCLACPFCTAAYPHIPLVPPPPDLAPPCIRMAQPANLSSPPRAPSFRPWSPTQPRAPPAVS
jgi:hypothetical protein